MAAGTGERVELGRINGAWGVTGWVKVYSFTDPPQNIFEYQPWQLNESPELIHVLEWKQQGSRLVARLDAIESREAAESMRGYTVSVPSEHLPEPENDRYYWHDLLGLEVINRSGQHLGKVNRLLDASVHDVLSVRTRDAEELLIPFVMGHYIEDVDLEQGCIRVDWERDWSDAD